MDIAVELVCASLFEGNGVDVPYCLADPVRMGTQQSRVQRLTRKGAWSAVWGDRREHLWWWTKGDCVGVVNWRAINKLDGITYADVDIAWHEKHYHGLTIRCPNSDMMVV